jgi:hypothetical protein
MSRARGTRRTEDGSLTGVPEAGLRHFRDAEEAAGHIDIKFLND